MITYIFAHNNGILSDIHGLDEVQKLEFVHKVQINISIGESVRTPENSDDRLGYVIFSSNSYQSLIENKKTIENLIDIVVK